MDGHDMVIHRVPTLLSSVGQQQQQQNNNNNNNDYYQSLQLYFLSYQQNVRATPINYLDVTLNDAHVDWLGCLNDKGGTEHGGVVDQCYYQDYQNRLAAAVRNVTTQSFTTEYAGPMVLSSSEQQQRRRVAIDVDVDDLVQSADWSIYLRKLEQAGVPAIPAVHAILDQYIPPKRYFSFEPPFQCAQWDHVYQPGRGTVSPTMDDCYDIFRPPNDGTTGWSWDPVGLTSDLETNILEPARKVQELLDASTYQSLTRFFGYNMITTADQSDHGIPEPHFVVNNHNKPNVDHIHKATAVPLCDLGVPSALEITIEQQQLIQRDLSSSSTTKTIADSTSSSSCVCVCN